MTHLHIFLAGVPATGKSMLGRWLAETQNHVHLDAERDSGSDFDHHAIHKEWDALIATAQPTEFGRAIRLLRRPVIVNWGFPVEYLYVPRALRATGFRTWWLRGDRDQARRAFIGRGGIPVHLFEQQMDAIEREWTHIESVFGSQIIDGLRPDGSQRPPSELWREILGAETL
jgi:hypothetical protein